MIWNGSNRRLESVIVHKNRITSLTFNTDGTRLLSADQVLESVIQIKSIELCFSNAFCLPGWSNYYLES